MLNAKHLARDAKYGYVHTLIRFGPVPKIRKPAGSNFFKTIRFPAGSQNTFSSRFQFFPKQYIFQPVLKILFSPGPFH